MQEPERRRHVFSWDSKLNLAVALSVLLLLGGAIAGYVRLQDAVEQETITRAQMIGTLAEQIAGMRAAQAQRIADLQAVIADGNRAQLWVIDQVSRQIGALNDRLNYVVQRAEPAR